MTLENVLLVSAALFAIGLYGVLSRRNLLVVLMSLEIMFNATVIAAIAFARFTPPAAVIGSSSPITASQLHTTLTGHAFALFVIGIAAAEAALAIALMFALYRARQTTEITEASELRN